MFCLISFLGKNVWGKSKLLNPQFFSPMYMSTGCLTRDSFSDRSCTLATLRQSFDFPLVRAKLKSWETLTLLVVTVKRPSKVLCPKCSTDHGMRNVHCDEGRLTSVFFFLLSLNNDPKTDFSFFLTATRKLTWRAPHFFHHFFNEISVRSTEMSVALLRFIKSAVLYMYQCVRESNRHQEFIFKHA